ncbi:carbamoyltransferase HypF [bacterium]|nr:carbamoyltransferase HypF [bacterium]
MKTIHYKCERIEIRGIVQGVGFRPFVHNLAHDCRLCGYVKNNPDGVVIEAEGAPEDIEVFISSLMSRAPVLSRIVELRRTVLDNEPGGRKYLTFEIRASDRTGKPQALISPDVCVCGDCLRELFDQHDRRYLYPFINCTNCGPRFSIIRRLPYDRGFTTMAGFIMCPDCEREYHDPADRRFHAQPDACPHCGPKLRLVDGDGRDIPGDPVLAAVELLRMGRIVAVKGLGGFHLAVDGAQDEAVQRLRSLKHREEKPLALMTGTIRSARKMIHLTVNGRAALESHERPIVLAPRFDGRAKSSPVAPSVAPGTYYLGIMLPYTPLHYLLFFHPQAGGDFAGGKPVFDALVMTSGNLSEDPICKDNDEALRRLSGIADAFLIHDREIAVRCDDSVVNAGGEEISFVRRSRGFAPVPVFLPEPVPPVLAFGGELKNTLCVTDGHRAFVSQHIGDLENIPTLGFFREAVDHFTGILELDPRVYACDLHPDYLSTRYCKQCLSERSDELYGVVGVQHHHAHITSVLAEHGHTGTVIGFSMDGTGYGLDETIWGGEVLISSPVSFVRFAHLDYVPMPGGTAAVREPWRMALSHLRAAYGDRWLSFDMPCLRHLSPHERELLDQACSAGLNSPRTSSLGRLFDAAASLLDIRHRSAFEGQAAMMLESAAAAGEHTPQTLPYTVRKSPPEIYDSYPLLWGSCTADIPGASIHVSDGCIIDYIPLIRGLMEEARRGKPVSGLAAAFHNTLAASFLEVAEYARESTGINTVALSGGCWQNLILFVRFRDVLKEHGFTVLTNRQVPVNDGGISLGQAYTAAACMRNRGI